MAGFRGLAELVGVWLGSPPAPEPEPIVAGSPALAVRVYHGESGEALEDWTGVGAVEVTFDVTGPTDGRIEAAATAPWLHHSRSMPNGVGVFVEIDGRSLGVPDVWLGRMVQPQFGAGPSVVLTLRGPSEWLDRISNPSQGVTAAPAGTVVREAVQGSRAQTWIAPRRDFGSTWSRIPFELSGQSLWSLMTGLADMRGEEFTLTARSRRVLFDLDWRHPLDAPEVDLVLEDGVNCSLSSSAINAGLPLDELVGAALSSGAGDELVGSIVSVAPAARLGLRAALTAPVTAAVLRRMQGSSGSAPAAMLPELTTQAALEAALETALRREMVLTAAVQLQDVAVSAWGRCRPGNIVAVRLRDPFGLFGDALLRIRTATWRLAPDLACSLSGELWSLADGGGRSWR